MEKLIKKAKRAPGFLMELMQRESADETRRQQIKRNLEIKNDFGCIIDSAKAVANELSANRAEQIKESEVRSVMKEDLGMRYRKIKTVSLHSNSEKNLVLRQRWALEFLNQARKRKIFLNVDETWIGMSDFRRRKW